MAMKSEIHSYLKSLHSSEYTEPVLDLISTEFTTTSNLEEAMKLFVKGRIRDRKSDGCIHPSSIGRCPREVIYNVMSVPKSNVQQVNPEMDVMASDGHVMEHYFYDVFDEMGLLRTYQQSFINHTDKVSGTTDFIIEYKGQLHIVDCKRVSNMRYKEAPMKNHIMQMYIYMLYMGIESGMLLYCSREFCNYKIITFNRNTYPAIFAETMQRLVVLTSSLSQKALPDVTTIKPKCTKASCEWFTQCTKDGLQQTAYID